MKKDLIFSPILLLVGVALCLLRWTGMPVHIAISVVGVITLAVYTVLTRKEWKCPALEIVTRLFYAVALITGALLMNIHGVIALSIVHKIGAVLFVILLICTEMHKTIKE